MSIVLVNVELCFLSFRNNNQIFGFIINVFRVELLMDCTCTIHNNNNYLHCIVNHVALFHIFIYIDSYRYTSLALSLYSIRMNIVHNLFQWNWSNLRHDPIGWFIWFIDSGCIIRCNFDMIVCACISWLSIVMNFFIGSKIFQSHFKTSRWILFRNAFLFVNIAWRVRVFLEKWHSASIMRNQR